MESEALSVTARPPRPCLYLELPLVLLEQSGDGENSTTSSPDRNTVILSLTPAYDVIPQRMLAKERLKEQGLNFRGFPQHQEKKVKHSLELIQLFGTAKGCAGSGKRDRSEG